MIAASYSADSDPAHLTAINRMNRLDQAAL
jgi:hypothetical protein